MLSPEARVAITRETKECRRELDEILQRIREPFAPEATGRRSRERALAATKIQEAIMWLGMDLKAQNDGHSCYKHGYDPASAEIEPPADGLKM